MAYAITKHRHTDLFNTQGSLEAPELNRPSTTQTPNQPQLLCGGKAVWTHQCAVMQEQEGINPKLLLRVVIGDFKGLNMLQMKHV